MTATSEAAAANITITSSTIKVGVAASLAAAATTKTAVISLTAGAVMAAGTAAIVPGTNNDTGKHTLKAESSSSMPLQTTANNGVEERWYYYPQNVDGPVMLRLVKWDSQNKQSYCQWWQDDQANYRFDESSNTIYINNYRTWNSELTVRRLPTDGINLTNFLSMVEGNSDKMEYVSGRGQGLLVIARQGGNEEDNHLQIIQHYNVLDEEYSRYKWPVKAKIQDKRDPMHKRGWTYFKITGQINSKLVRGRGRIPFIYAARKRHWPWLELKVGNRIEAQAGFTGLSRPWMGLHTIDTVRRDAA
jgi:hypothetical protein